LTNYPKEYLKVLEDLETLQINFPDGNSQENLKDDLKLQTTALNGSKVVWSSSLVSVIKVGGQVTPLQQKDLPNKKLQYVVVELTAKVTSIAYPARFSGTKVFNVVVFASDSNSDTISSRINFEPKISFDEYSEAELDNFAKLDVLTEYGKKTLSLIQATRININNLSDRVVTKNQIERFYSNVKNDLGLHLNDVIYNRANDFIKLVESNPESSARANLLQIINENRESSMRVEHQKSVKHNLDLANQASNSTKILLKYGLILLAILLFLLLQGLTTSFAAKKGYEGFKWTLIASIPIFGIVYFNLIPKKRNVSKEGLKSVFKPKQIIGRILVYLEIVVMVIVVLIPVVYIFGMGLSGLRTNIPNEIWPSEPTFKAFTYLFNETNFTGWYSNTLMIAFVNMIFGTLIITGASYVFARFSFKGKRAGLLALLGLQSFPTFMSLIAMYVLFWRFGLLGRPIALSIIYIGGSIPGNLWLVKGFLDQVPRDLDESAMIDGANKLQIFFSIILPLAIPILTFVAVNMFMGPWMDYMLPGYLLNVPPVGAPTDYDVKQNWTLAVGLFDFINNQDNINYSAFAAGALMVGLPITVLYMVFQKYLIEGIMAGATKG
jgi:arabinogalactan oligomer/maltooligosaccharide transport system permease protein